jgi:4-amino-4-deoxychorismate lyase
VLRGEGVFETLLVVGDKPVELEAHLAQLGRSAAMLELPAPDLTAWRACVRRAIQAWSGEPPEMVLRVVLTRGRDPAAGGCPHAVGYALGEPVAPTVLAQRRDGVAALTLTRGIGPWPVTPRGCCWVARR